METLLDHHLATFDTWVHALLMAFNATILPYHYLTVITLLDQLDSKKFHWQQVSVILQHQLPLFHPDKFHILFDGTKLNIELTRIVSKFLMDRDRAGSLWVNFYQYADLAKYIAVILGDK